MIAQRPCADPSATLVKGRGLRPPLPYCMQKFVDLLVHAVIFAIPGLRFHGPRMIDDIFICHESDLGLDSR